VVPRLRAARPRERDRFASRTWNRFQWRDSARQGRGMYEWKHRRAGHDPDERVLTLLRVNPGVRYRPAPQSTSRMRREGGARPLGRTPRGAEQEVANAYRVG